MKRFAVLMVLALIVALPLSADAWTRRTPTKNLRDTSIELYSWRNELTGNGNVKGMSLDFDSETTFGTKNRMGGRVTVPVTNTTNVTLEYNSFEHSGNITKAVTFDKKVYNANANIRLENSWVDLTAARVISNCANGYWDFLYGLKYNNTNLDITGVSAGVTRNDSWSEKFPIPYIGIGGGSKLGDRVWLDGALKFISINAGGGNVKSYDFDVNLGFQLNGSKKANIQKGHENDSEWFAMIGYRTFMIDGSFDNDEAKIGYKGPVFGIMARF